jgi:predicted aminopeptidase
MLKPTFLLLCLSILNACGHINYYSQAFYGQWEIVKLSQPIESIITHQSTDPLLKQKLRDVLKMRAFATETLYLPDNGSYTYYADLKRPFAVWSVFATPALSLKPKQWCFFIVGCVSYRGYFSEAAAQTLAQKLRVQGYDVYLAGIPAFSTLGWFEDPVLNTILAWPSYQIAGIIFHELAHQKLYISNDTAFNEAFAMILEYIGTERWLAQYGTPQDIVAYQQARQRQQEFTNLVLTTRNHLEHIYAQNGPLAHKQRAKTAAFEQLRQQYQQLKQQWGGFTGYDAWFAKDLNNAKLLSIVTYEDNVPAFRALLEQVNGDLPTFYQIVAKLGELPREERHVQLEKIGKTN